jgi:2-(3-amino-3-carboxypropyl)histidine synthase
MVRDRMKLEEQYDLKLEDVSKSILDNQYETILLQFPEGLKNFATEIKDTLQEKTKASVMISANPCYGACDLPLSLEGLGINLLVQFGHADMPAVQSTVPTIFIEAHSKAVVMPVVEKALPYLKESVGLITTVQHIHKLEDVRNFLSERGYKPVIGKGEGRILHNGQVLGCNFSSATSISSDVDCFLFIGSGNFHAIGVSIATKKPVIIADPYQNEIREIDEEKDKLMRQRHGAITKAESAESFGILIGTKPGQKRVQLAYDLNEAAEKHGKKTYILVMHEFNPMNLKSFKLDAYVSTACPRIAIDDLLMYDAPILTPQEFMIVLRESEWEYYKFDELF